MANEAVHYRSSKISKREPRFDITDLRCCCFVRNVNMRAATFEMNVLDISHDGASIRDSSLNCIAFKSGDILTATIDINRKIFSRPINIRYRVVHAQINGLEKNYGLVLLDVNDFHRNAYEEGLKGLPSEREISSSIFYTQTRSTVQTPDETPTPVARKLHVVSG